jgi:hypothetical protein
LTPQGKLLFDFFVVPLPEDPRRLPDDCAGEQTADLVKRLNLHKMRAKIAIEDKSKKFAVVAILGRWPGSGLFHRDMRGPIWAYALCHAACLAARSVALQHRIVRRAERRRRFSLWRRLCMTSTST